MADAPPARNGNTLTVALAASAILFSLIATFIQVREQTRDDVVATAVANLEKQLSASEASLKEQIAAAVATLEKQLEDAREDRVRNSALLLDHDRAIAELRTSVGKHHSQRGIHEDLAAELRAHLAEP